MRMQTRENKKKEKRGIPRVPDLSRASRYAQLYTFLVNASRWSWVIDTRVCICQETAEHDGSVKRQCRRDAESSAGIRGTGSQLCRHREALSSLRNKRWRKTYIGKHLSATVGGTGFSSSSSPCSRPLFTVHPARSFSLRLSFYLIHSISLSLRSTRQRLTAMTVDTSETPSLSLSLSFSAHTLSRFLSFSLRDSASFPYGDPSGHRFDRWQACISRRSGSLQREKTR